MNSFCVTFLLKVSEKMKSFIQKLVMQLFTAIIVKIVKLNWPVQSPDFNPIENILLRISGQKEDCLTKLWGLANK